ncbi:MAG: SRPBCC domain-containing protein [Acidobacteriia bacterium]|nr:SRPBCC domain-containing protein [Terriglobia bacterium]
MRANPGTGIIEKKVLIQASPAVIFRALTEAKDMAQWFCDRVTSDPRVGGEIKAYWRMGGSGQAQRGRAIFTSLIADSQVELHWVDEGEGESAGTDRHTICYTIRLKRGTSEVTVRDAGPPPADEETLEILNQGWISVLRDLKEHCEARQRNARRRSAGESKAD